MRICIVDDSESFRIYLESLLRQAGHDDVVSHASAEAFLAALGRRDARLPDLVLMDCIMPGQGGLGGTRRMKADPALADIPVIMITVSDDDENLAAAFAAGAMDFIRKPPRRPELLSRVDSALRLKQAIDERKARERELKAEKDGIAAILEYSHDGIAVLGHDGRFTFVSPGMERIFGLPADTYTTADRWIDTVFPDAAAQHDLADIVASRPAPGHVWQRLYPFADKNGQRRTCQIHFSTMPVGDLILNIEDVTLFAKQKEDLEKKHSRHQKDLEAAAEIQQSLLPRRFSMTDSLKFAWEFWPCESIGGDIFNVFPLGPRHVGLYMLDVSGHGVASSLVALSVYNFMHYQRSTLIDRSEGRIDVVPPEVVLEKLDEEFPFQKFSKFFTMFYMALDLATGQARYCNAGHPPPWRVTPAGDILALPVRGTIVGLGGFQPYRVGEVTLAPGDKLILVSDGLADTLGPGGLFYGEERTLAILRDKAGSPVGEVLAAMRTEAAAFCGHTPPRDDVSLLGVEFMRQKA
ncbi:putative PAS/PAC sensor protein [Solidesulfovibrio carbinoliphilus subsp. oakridgensis]|uniref:PAS/PAC sensor protein n=1 Tax=Solidesulfovibrio carbinoliphilus subsp. oakridgensis TaxID=694327 RepID=G7Q7V1_9BACT|nr:SpoIIE family protein phosphatase [Solidesulfovibrio carbinoliphilus]EHJ47645.1 putative PAS/PAC sensor protein [Solidesulfovibrio carbinoliphilus subsp. oakridgensis]